LNSFTFSGAPNPAASTYYGALPQAIQTAGPGTNSYGGVTNRSSNVGGFFYPAATTLGATLYSFNAYFVGGWQTGTLGSGMFTGLSPYGTPFTSAVISGVANTIGICWEAADTNLQWIVTNNAGTTVKTAVGPTIASILNHLMVLSITGSNAGLQLSLTDLDNSGIVYNFSVAQSSASYPSTTVPVFFYSHLNTAALATPAQVMSIKKFVWSRNMGV
jgi:hypothetical protein